MIQLRFATIPFAKSNIRKTTAKGVLTLFACLTLIASAQAQENREWKQCTEDNECVIVGGGCCLDSVNKTFQAEGEQYCKAMNAHTQCLKFLDPAQAQAVCRHTSVPCMNNAPEGCLSKKAKCIIAEDSKE